MAKKWDDGLPDTNKKWLGPIGEQIDFRPLFKILNDSGIQTKNPSLYQVIDQLLKNAQQNKDLTTQEFNAISIAINGFTVSINVINELFKDATFLTAENEVVKLPNSRELIAGTNITLDKTIPNKEIINATGGGGGNSGDALGLLGVFDNRDGEDSLIPGPPGLQGAQGIQGNPGINGIGIPGEDGIDGIDSLIPGPAGPPGNTGSTGPQGIPGFNGLDGIDGIDGIDSIIPGPVGPTGSPGSIGPAGLSGVQGLDGQDGQDGLDSYIPGQQGIQGIQGVAGLDGIQPAELLLLAGKTLKKIWFLEQVLGANYRTNDLTGPDVPSEAELISLEEIDLLENIVNVTYNQRLRSFGVTVDGGGTVITTGNKGNWRAPYNGTIIGWTLLATDGLTGSAVMDVYKDTYDNFPPTAADSITGGSKPTISSSNKATSSLLPWILNFNAGDVFGFNLDSVSTFTRLTLEVFALVT